VCREGSGEGPLAHATIVSMRIMFLPEYDGVYALCACIDLLAHA
jgi:hypothetical protein